MQAGGGIEAAVWKENGRLWTSHRPATEFCAVRGSAGAPKHGGPATCRGGRSATLDVGLAVLFDGAGRTMPPRAPPPPPPPPPVQEGGGLTLSGSGPTPRVVGISGDPARPDGTELRGSGTLSVVPACRPVVP